MASNQTYTVFVKAEGHTGNIPVSVGGQEPCKMSIPFNTEVTGVPEAVVAVLKNSYPEGKYEKEPGFPPAKTAPKETVPAK